MIGCYIAEYELRGADRATYGERLLVDLSVELVRLNVGACGRRQLYQYLRFYQTYPQIVRLLTAQLLRLLPEDIRNSRKKTKSAALSVGPHRLLRYLSYTHIDQLLAIPDDLKRAFYEIECIRGNWSVSELKRQIGSLYYERSGLSRNKKKLAALVRSGAEQAESKLVIRDPYVFEFLGLRPVDVMGESDLENALIDKLQWFLLELGHGFCFEARQKRILIGDTYGFVDLVFYHRVLKCHVLIDLKIKEFTHEHLGQLNTYVSWYRTNVMSAGDNPPVGILLCTQKNHALVKYALAGMSNSLFVSKYQLELPGKEEMEKFIERQIIECPIKDDDSRTARLVRELREKYLTGRIVERKDD
jgi:predicted nuclease of restriction endonuclease-like (RecB) superfamily